MPTIKRHYMREHSNVIRIWSSKTADSVAENPVMNADGDARVIFVTICRIRQRILSQAWKRLKERTGVVHDYGPDVRAILSRKLPDDAYRTELEIEVLYNWMEQVKNIDPTGVAATIVGSRKKTAIYNALQQLRLEFYEPGETVLFQGDMPRAEDGHFTIFSGECEVVQFPEDSVPLLKLLYLAKKKKWDESKELLRSGQILAKIQTLSGFGELSTLTNVKRAASIRAASSNRSITEIMVLPKDPLIECLKSKREIGVAGAATSEAIDFMRQSGLANRISPKDLVLAASSMIRRTLLQGEILFFKGDTVQSMFLVVSGDFLLDIGPVQFEGTLQPFIHSTADNCYHLSSGSILGDEGVTGQSNKFESTAVVVSDAAVVFEAVGFGMHFLAERISSLRYCALAYKEKSRWSTPLLLAEQINPYTYFNSLRKCIAYTKPFRGATSSNAATKIGEEDISDGNPQLDSSSMKAVNSAAQIVSRSLTRSKANATTSKKASTADARKSNSRGSFGVDLSGPPSSKRDSVSKAAGSITAAGGKVKRQSTMRAVSFTPNTDTAAGGKRSASVASRAGKEGTRRSQSPVHASVSSTTSSTANNREVASSTRYGSISSEAFTGDDERARDMVTAVGLHHALEISKFAKKRQHDYMKSQAKENILLDQLMNKPPTEVDSIGKVFKKSLKDFKEREMKKTREMLEAAERAQPQVAVSTSIQFLSSLSPGKPASSEADQDATTVGSRHSSLDFDRKTPPRLRSGASMPTVSSPASAKSPNTVEQPSEVKPLTAKNLTAHESTQAGKDSAQFCGGSENHHTERQRRRSKDLSEGEPRQHHPFSSDGAEGAKIQSVSAGNNDEAASMCVVSAQSRAPAASAEARKAQDQQSASSHSHPRRRYSNASHSIQAQYRRRSLHHNRDEEEEEEEEDLYHRQHHAHFDESAQEDSFHTMSPIEKYFAWIDHLNKHHYQMLLKQAKQTSDIAHHTAHEEFLERVEKQGASGGVGTTTSAASAAHGLVGGIKIAQSQSSSVVLDNASANGSIASKRSSIKGAPLSNTVPIATVLQRYGLTPSDLNIPWGRTASATAADSSSSPQASPGKLQLHTGGHDLAKTPSKETPVPILNIPSSPHIRPGTSASGISENDRTIPINSKLVQQSGKVSREADTVSLAGSVSHNRDKNQQNQVNKATAHFKSYNPFSWRNDMIRKKAVGLNEIQSKFSRASTPYNRRVVDYMHHALPTHEDSDKNTKAFASTARLSHNNSSRRSSPKEGSRAGTGRWNEDREEADPLTPSHYHDDNYILNQQLEYEENVYSYHNEPDEFMSMIHEIDFPLRRRFLPDHTWSTRFMKLSSTNVTMNLPGVGKHPGASPSTKPCLRNDSATTRVDRNGNEGILNTFDDGNVQKIRSRSGSPSDSKFGAARPRGYSNASSGDIQSARECSKSNTSPEKLEQKRADSREKVTRSRKNSRQVLAPIPVGTDAGENNKFTHDSASSAETNSVLTISVRDIGAERTATDIDGATAVLNSAVDGLNVASMSNGPRHSLRRSIQFDLQASKDLLRKVQNDVEVISASVSIGLLSRSNTVTSIFEDGGDWISPASLEDAAQSSQRSLLSGGAAVQPPAALQPPLSHPSGGVVAFDLRSQGLCTAEIKNINNESLSENTPVGLILHADGGDHHPIFDDSIAAPTVSQSQSVSKSAPGSAGMMTGAIGHLIPQRTGLPTPLSNTRSTKSLLGGTGAQQKNYVRDKGSSEALQLYDNFMLSNPPPRKFFEGRKKSNAASKFKLMQIIAGDDSDICAVDKALQKYSDTALLNSLYPPNFKDQLSTLRTREKINILSIKQATELNGSPIRTQGTRARGTGIAGNHQKWLDSDASIGESSGTGSNYSGRHKLHQQPVKLQSQQQGKARDGHGNKNEPTDIATEISRLFTASADEPQLGNEVLIGADGNGEADRDDAYSVGVEGNGPIKRSVLDKDTLEWQSFTVDEMIMTKKGTHKTLPTISSGGRHGLNLGTKRGSLGKRFNKFGNGALVELPGEKDYAPISGPSSYLDVYKKHFRIRSSVKDRESVANQLKMQQAEKRIF